jgi:PhnB protein
MYWRIGPVYRQRPGKTNQAAFLEVVKRGPPPGLLAFDADAVVLESNQDGPTLLQIGDSLVWVEAGELPPHVTPWVGSVYVYVEDVDTVYARAMELGAKSISAPEDKPYNERQAGFVDVGGNIWWVSRYMGAAS